MKASLILADDHQVVRQGLRDIISRTPDLQVVGQRFTPAADAAIILSSETVFAALAGFIFLNERLTGLQLLGAALILANIVLVEIMPMTRFGRPRPLN